MRTYTVEVIVTEEDTSFVYSVSEDEVRYDSLGATIKLLAGQMLAEIDPNS